MSRALAGSETITEATRSRVERAAAELGYQVNARAAGLRRGETGTIAIVVIGRDGEGPTAINPFYYSLLGSTCAAAAEAEATLADARRRLEEASTLAARQSIAATQVRGLESEVEVARSSLAGARAEARRQSALLARHSLKAPFDGVISQKQTEVGEWVTPGTSVLELVSLEDLRADLSVPQEYFPRVSKNDRLEVRLGGDSGPAYPATISAIVPVNDPSARTFLVRAQLESPPAMTPGMSVRATLFLQGDEASLAVPRDALVRYPDGRVSVWLAEEGDDGLVAREQRIRIGDGLADLVTVKEGLSAGDRVVVRGNESLTDGRALRVSE